MKNLLLFVFFFLFTHFSWGQNCPAGCSPSNSMEATDCLDNGATQLNIEDDIILATDADLSGVSICIKNATLTIPSGVLIDSNTEFTDLGGSSTGAAITIGGTTYEFDDSNDADGTIAELNATIALGTSGNIGAAVVALLPVELSSYTALIQKNDIQLKWETSSESNNSHFILEHSLNGIDYREVAKIQGQGNSSVKHFYTYTHSSPEKGINYYRLWQFDFDGHYENLGIISAKFGDNDKISISPNPVGKGRFIYLSTPIKAENITSTGFFLVYMNGQKRKLNLIGDKTLSLPSNLGSGLYFVRIITGQEQFSIPLFIE